MDENIKQNSPQEPTPKPASPTQGGPVSYTRSKKSSPNFFDKFFSIFTKKTVAGLVILILVIGVGAATIAVQRSTEIRQLAATAPTPPCNIPASLLTQLGLPTNTIRGYGDVNGRDGVTSVDSALILQKEAGLITLTPVQLEAADVNGPPNVLSSAGNVNSVDSTLILQYVAGLITTFSSVCSSSPTTAPTPIPTTPPGVTVTPTPNCSKADVNSDGVVNTTDANLTSSHFGETPSSPGWDPKYDQNNDNRINIFDLLAISACISATNPPPGVPTPTSTSTTPCRIPASLGVGTGYYGDVNGDGRVNSVDSSLILQREAGLLPTPFTPAQIEAADVNDRRQNVLSSAGDVNSADSSLILQYEAGLTDTFPVCSSPPPPTPTTSPIPDCNSGSTCTACTAPANTCGGTGTQNCTLTTHSGGSACNQVSNTAACTTAPNNCNTGNVCINNQCAVPTGNPTPIPTITPAPGDTLLALSIGLDAIGTTGDNNTPNDSSGSNKTPKRPTRNVKVEVFDTNDNPVANKSGTLAYQTGSGKFTGNIDMGNLASGNYTVKVKSDGYLRRLIPGIHQNITSGQTYNLPAANLVTGNINGDNAIDILDYNILISCFSTESIDNHALCNSNAQYAVLSDLEDNGAVNQLDYNLFLRELSVQNGD